MNMAYDSLNYARKLKRLGIPEKQANAHAQVLADFTESHLATKGDIKELRADMQEMGALIRSEVKDTEASIRSDMKAIEVSIRSDMKDTEAAIRADMQEMGALIRSEAKDTEAAIRSDMKDMEAAIRSEMKDLNTTVLLLKSEFETFKIYIAEKIKSSELGMKIFVGVTVYSAIIALGYYQKFY